MSTGPGRGPFWIAGEESAGIRLDKFLAAAERLGSRGRGVAALQRGKVYLNGREASAGDAARRLEIGDEVRVWMDKPGSARARPRPGRAGAVEVLFEDDALVVVNKPAGLLSVPLERKPDLPSAYDAIVQRLRSHGKHLPLVVHRIDQETSGLVVFAKTIETQARLREQFRRRQPERIYQAVVQGHPAPASGTWRDLLVWDDRALVQRPARPADAGALHAISEYQVLEPLAESALLAVRLRTGRRNQIRIQAALRGHPLIGESRYLYQPAESRIPFRRTALHAWRLGFEHAGQRLRFEAPLPADLSRLLERLRSRRKAGSRSR
jgi:23S rRNA pseudouridine1911/1915/1917 synthase